MDVDRLARFREDRLRADGRLDRGIDRLARVARRRSDRRVGWSGRRSGRWCRGATGARCEEHDERDEPRAEASQANGFHGGGDGRQERPVPREAWTIVHPSSRRASVGSEGHGRDAPSTEPELRPTRNTEP